MSGGLDPSIILGYQPPQINIGQDAQDANSLLQLRQNKQQVQQQNALAALYRNPKNLGSDGMLTPDALKQVMGIDPTTGLKISDDQAKAQGDQLTLASAQGDFLNQNVGTPALEDYQTKLASMGPQAALASAQKVYQDGLKTAAASGLFPSDVVSKWNPNFDPTRVQGHIEAFKDWQTNNTNNSKLQQKSDYDDALLTNDQARLGLGQERISIQAANAGVAVPGGGGVPAPSSGAPSPAAALSSATQTQPSVRPAAAPPGSLQARPATVGADTSAPAETAAPPRITPTAGYDSQAITALAQSMAANGMKMPNGLPSGAPGRALRAQISNLAAYYQSLDPVKPGQNINDVANGIATYQMAPLTGYSMSTPHGQAIMAKVLQINPNYQEADYAGKAATIVDFDKGPQGNNVRSIDTSVLHVQTLIPLIQALGNGNVQTINKLSNWYSQETGQPAVTNFDAAKSVVGDEITKAIVSGVGSVTDRQDIQQDFNKASSPQQLLGVAQTLEKLLGGQLTSLQQQFTSSTGLPASAFQAKLLPGTASILSADDAPSGGGTVLHYDAQGNLVQ